MHEVAANPRTGAPGSVLASLFSKAARLARADAILTALLCGGIITLVVSKLGEHDCSAIAWGVVLGLLVAFVAYIAIAPESMVTACLVSARKYFLDNQVTRTQWRQMRKQCLRKSLLY